MKIALAALAATFALVGNVPYLRDVLRRRIQPHPYTWLVWSCVSAITLAGQYAKGAGIGALPTAVAESFTIIIFVFSLQYGFRNIKRVDTVFLVVAGLRKKEGCGSLRVKRDSAAGVAERVITLKRSAIPSIKMSKIVFVRVDSKATVSTTLLS
jgi:hypothetical protein